jgi:hypothetical protein
LESISVGGLGVIADDPLPVATDVTISYGDGGLSAVVRRCQPFADRYAIGVEFVGNSKVGSLRLQPEMLLWPM